MIPRDYITEWRNIAPWIQDVQVEQDLIICRALVAIFSDPELAKALAFRGGTALNKLHFRPATRYSEDIDLVQIDAGKAGPTIDRLRAVLDPWLGTPHSKRSEKLIGLTYRFQSEDQPPLPMKLKVEINTREHFAVHGFIQQTFEVQSRWFGGSCSISTYGIDELMGTKLRALFQRRKGRDLYDLAIALEREMIDPSRVINTFLHYMKHEGHEVKRADFMLNFEGKMNNKQFKADLSPLLASGVIWDQSAGAELVVKNLLSRLPE